MTTLETVDADVLLCSYAITQGLFRGFTFILWENGQSVIGEMCTTSGRKFQSHQEKQVNPKFQYHGEQIEFRTSCAR